jgi:hypothetical protein
MKHILNELGWIFIIILCIPTFFLMLIIQTYYGHWYDREGRYIGRTLGKLHC